MQSFADHDDQEDNLDSLHAAIFAAKLSNLPEDVQEEIISILGDSGAVAWSLDDLRPSDVPVTQNFELETETPIHSRAPNLPPRHATVVRPEL